jgi:hypothetical protein
MKAVFYDGPADGMEMEIPEPAPMVLKVPLKNRKMGVRIFEYQLMQVSEVAPVAEYRLEK